MAKVCFCIRERCFYVAFIKNLSASRLFVHYTKVSQGSPLCRLCASFTGSNNAHKRRNLINSHTHIEYTEGIEPAAKPIGSGFAIEVYSQRLSIIKPRQTIRLPEFKDKRIRFYLCSVNGVQLQISTCFPDNDHRLTDNASGPSCVMFEYFLFIVREIT